MAILDHWTYYTEDAMPTWTVYSCSMQSVSWQAEKNSLLKLTQICLIQSAYDFSSPMQKSYKEVTINNKLQKYNRNVEPVRHVLSWLTDNIQITVAPSCDKNTVPLDSNNDIQLRKSVLEESHAYEHKNIQSDVCKIGEICLLTMTSHRTLKP